MSFYQKFILALINADPAAFHSVYFCIALMQLLKFSVTFALNQSGDTSLNVEVWWWKCSIITILSSKELETLMIQELNKNSYCSTVQTYQTYNIKPLQNGNPAKIPYTSAFTWRANLAKNWLLREWQESAIVKFKQWRCDRFFNIAATVYFCSLISIYWPLFNKV